MKRIKDSVHDHIEVAGVARDLLDTPEVQRLRRIAQLGTVSLVYPSANHTRFEHSLGVYHLATQALETLGIEGPRAAHVQAAALLHDIGHGPFSHNLEELIERRTGRYHDEVLTLVSSGMVGDILGEHGLDPARIADLIAGEGQDGQLVSGELDVDRMDYLVRDAHHTGVPYGTIDHERLVRELTYADGTLVLAEGNVQTAESLLVARALMNPTVYSHSVARISKAMLRRASERLLEAGETDAEALARMDDHDLVVALRQSASTRSMMRRLDERRLLKRALWAELSDVPSAIVDADHERVRTLEQTIAERAGVDPDIVIIDIRDRPAMRESSTRVMVNGEIRHLDHQSPLVEALRDAAHAQWRLGVYAPRPDREAVGRAAVEVMGLDIEGPLISEGPGGLYTTLDEFAG